MNKNNSKTTDSTWRPPFWKEEQFSSSWERVKTAMMRDWEQTRHDMHAGGHELRQNIGDTVNQARGKEAVPANDGLNPAKVVDTLRADEIPFGYGYGARTQYGTQYKEWNNDLEQKLRMDWEGGKAPTQWDEVKDKVKYGFDYKQ